MKTLIMGGGIAGLTTGHVLNKNKIEVIVFEKEKEVGGLSRTIKHNSNLFDLGGHRFWTKKEELNQFLRDLIGKDLLEVSRSSKIYFNNKFYDYPLKFSAIISLGPFRTLITGADFVLGRIIYKIKKERKDVSFEEYIIERFGYQLYKYFFKDYTEKIWGIPCTKICSEWAVQRIKNLSMTEVIKNMIKPKKDIATLVTKFYYPKYGIGQISDKLAKPLKVIHAPVTEIETKKDKIISVNGIKADHFVSTIPITDLVRLLNAPKPVLEAAKSLQYRDEMFVFIALKADKITDESWIYFPDADIPFARMHEPKNWSPYMCKKGQASVVLEFFCKKGDPLWVKTDEELVRLGLKHLKRLGLYKDQKVLDYKIIRAEHVYPIYEIGYYEYLDIIKKYLQRYKNLHIIGRTGFFRYMNIDHVFEVGIKCAENIMGAKHDLSEVATEKEYLEEKKK